MANHVPAEAVNKQPEDAGYQIEAKQPGIITITNEILTGNYPLAIRGWGYGEEGLISVPFNSGAWYISEA